MLLCLKILCSMTGNNPFNIRSGCKWLGLVGSRKGFCVFDSLEYGVRAACVLLLQSYRKKRVYTIRSIIGRFAPVSENDTSLYIQYVCASTGYSSRMHLFSLVQYAKILSAMAWYETHTRISVSYILEVIRKYNIFIV